MKVLQSGFCSGGKVLPGDLTHYVVPDVGVVVDYQEILEFRELQGIVFTQTACQAVQHSKGRRYTHARAHTRARTDAHTGSGSSSLYQSCADKV